MRILAFGLCVAFLALISGNILVTVDAAERAVILREGNAARVLGPGVHLKLPLVERAGVIGADYQRRVTTMMTVPLTDGPDCTISASVDYMVGDAVRAVRWRLRHGLDVSKKSSVFGGRADYVEPERIFRNALAVSISAMTARDVSRGALEGWLRDFVTAENGKVRSDGTRILGAAADRIVCTNGYAAAPSRRPECVFGAAVSFAAIDDQPEQPAPPIRVSSDQIVITPRDIEVVLIDRNRVVIGGFHMVFAISDADRFTSRFGALKLAESRLDAVAKKTIASIVATQTPGALAAFAGSDLQDQITAALAPKLERLGLSVEMVSVNDAFYRLGELAVQSRV